MRSNKSYDVIIVGGSYAGLAAAMALGRALRRVLVIDSGYPANRQTPYSHNFLTQDGKAPAEITKVAKQQVTVYNTVEFHTGLAAKAIRHENSFEIRTSTNQTFTAAKLIFATGINDIMPASKGFAESWGISLLHCPYCHGYEVRNAVTGVLGNGEAGFEMARLISNWTKHLLLFTNGISSLTKEQSAILEKHGIKVVEKEIEELQHKSGHIQNVSLADGSKIEIEALYARLPFTQHSAIPKQLECEFTEEGYIKVDPMQKTSVKGIFAAGDNSGKMRTVANAVATGTTAGMMVNKELIEEGFE